MSNLTAAVIVDKAYKYYGHDHDRKVILNQLDMRVERGTIYGLLGASGCGKTTLLSCIVGRRRLNNGKIWVLGGEPGSRGSGVPGPRIGYMPQDIALVGEFTVKDAVYYFGRIFGMNTIDMEERFEFLSKLLDLPPHNRLIKNLSGGQQRRVSFAAALVQNPELLILDEPTVGLDPLLRERIWDFLVSLASSGVSVIITTHYIDETKQANKIGLLRGGTLLAEESPVNLLRRCNAATLEEAFLSLAVKQQSTQLDKIEYSLPSDQPELSQPIETQHDKETSASVIHHQQMQRDASNLNNYNSKEDFTRICNNSTEMLSKENTIEDDSSDHKYKSRKLKGTALGRYKAIFIKSMLQFSRHPGGLIFSLIFPIIQTVAFFSAIGHDPRSLNIGVVNYEAMYSDYGVSVCENETLKHTMRIEDDCQLTMISCKFLKLMEKRDLKTVLYNDVETAIDAVRVGKHYASIHFAADFSSALQERFKAAIEVDDNSLNKSSALIWLDMTNHQISLYLKTELLKVYEDFSRSLMVDCGFVPGTAQIPVHFEQPIYGSMEPNYSFYMAPGIMMTILFFLAATITSTLMISERLEGVWERSAVAGVRPHELLTVHITIQSSVILVQTIEMMLLGFLGYGLPSRGSTGAVFFLLFIQGLAGMCYGFLLSVTCSSYTLAFFISTGSFYPMILLCGILWPLEGMSAGLRAIARALPFTVPSSALRDIMEKGLTIWEVKSGFMIALGWIIVTIILCLVALRVRKS